MPTPYSLDLTRLAEAYARGALTPENLVHDVYAAIAAEPDNPIWIHLVPQAQVIEQVRALGQRRAAGETLPLYGVPFAVKDNIDVAGCPTTAACPAFSYVPAQSAYAVHRLQDAGALVIGKTNLDQFATGLVGTRTPYGACYNVFNRDYISGGSSSGSAVAVAAGMVSFALGTDTAGSGRVPAGFNNVVGLKPTHGVVSTRGVVPACRSLDCVSVFALTCDDATRVFDAMRGYDPDDSYARSDIANVRNAPLAGAHFRCGVPPVAQRLFFGDDAARVAFDAALDILRSAGAELVEIDYQPFADAARMLYEGPWVAEREAAVGKFVEAHADKVDPVVRKIIAGATRWNAADAFEAQYRLRDYRRCSEMEWTKMDVLAVPTAGAHYTLTQIAADPLQLNRNLGYYTNFVNLLDLCALAVPGPFRADGLPAGVTLIAAAHSDGLLAQIGARFHRDSRVLLGATRFELPASVPVAASHVRDEVVLAVVGAHLSGLSLNHQLTSRGARLLETTRTAPLYRLYTLPMATPPKPGLVRVADGGAAIDVELWAMNAAAFGAFVAEVPPPLSIGTLTLIDGRVVKGFLSEAWAVAGAPDISEYGGWRCYLAAQAAQQ